MNDTDKKRYIDFAAFRSLAADPRLSSHQKVDDARNARGGKEALMFGNIRAKLPQLDRRGQRVFDIGSGCDGLPRIIMEHAERLGHRLTLIDSAEMLSALPNSASAEKISAEFPNCDDVISANAGKCDAVIVYSVIHYVFVHADIWAFFDAALSLLAPGGGLLIGDIPSRSKRDRFLMSDAGTAMRDSLRSMGRSADPRFNRLAPGEIDDAVIQGLIARGTAAGFDGYILPQPRELPFAETRIDLLFTRP